MKRYQLIDLINKQIEQLNVKCHPFSGIILDRLIYKGLSDEDIIKHAIPKLIELAQKRPVSKTDLDEICSDPNLDLLPEPIRHIVDKTPYQRRLDGLARLLLPQQKITACVAVAFCKESGRWVVSSNSPRDKNEEQLTHYFACKMGIIQAFLLQLMDNTTFIDQIEMDVEKIQFSTHSKLLATHAVSRLIAEENGGAGVVVPSGIHRHKERNTSKSHLENALLKLGQYFLLSLYTKGKKGFTEQERVALLGSKIMMILPNKKFFLSGEQLHAEQAIVYYLKHFTSFAKNETNKKVYIGISKLCCQTCSAVLLKRNDINIRGGHGMLFQNVYVTDHSLFNPVKTKLNADQCATDSSSNPEFYDESSEPDENAIPTIEDLLKPKEPPLLTFKSSTTNSLFRCVTVKAEEIISNKKEECAIKS